MRRVKVRSFSQHDRSRQRQKDLCKEASLSIVRVKRLPTRAPRKTIRTRQDEAEQSSTTVQGNEISTEHPEVDNTVENVQNDSIVQIEINDTPRLEAALSVPASKGPSESVRQRREVVAAPHVTISFMDKRRGTSKSFSFATAVVSPNNAAPSPSALKSNSVIPVNENFSSEKDKNSAKKSARRLPYRLSSAKNVKTTDLPDKERKDTEKSPGRRRRKGCFKCSTCCCVGSILGAILLLAGLAGLIIALLGNKSTKITTATSTTVTTETTTTATTTTTTTSQTTTSTSTTSTATTVTTTSATTSTSTSATTTTTTSATTTTATTTTATTSTSETTTTPPSTTTTTPLPPCLPTSVGSASILFTSTSPSNISYNCHTYNWTASTTGSVTLAFVLRHDPDYWYLDDVAVYYYGTNLIVNGDFETGSLSPWVRTTPNGACAGDPGAVRTLDPHTGTYSMTDGSNGCADQISQSFVVTAGEGYIVSFWMRSGSLGTVITANVTLF